MKSMSAEHTGASKDMAKLAQQGISALTERMGKVALGVAVVLWIAWFFLPGVKLDLGFMGAKSYTFWEFLGLDLSGPPPFSIDHGFFSLLGLVAIAAPFAAPFIRDPRARFLNVLPLAYVVIASLALRWNIGRAAGPMQPEILDSISARFGSYLLVIASLALSVQAFKAKATHNP